MVLSKRPWCKGHTNFNQKTDVANFKKKKDFNSKIAQT